MAESTPKKVYALVRFTGKDGKVVAQGDEISGDDKYIAYVLRRGLATATKPKS